ncbi:glutamate synthase-related protein [Desulfocicer niacini]
MATIDLASIPMRTANEVIRGYGATHQDIDILNPDAKHYIAVGLTHPVNVSIKGSAGYFCGGLSDGPHINVNNNVSWGVGDNMLSGCIVVGGNAGAIAGEALRGGEIVIRGNMGSRAGQVMKKGTLCCCGNSSFMAGYMMYGGKMIILGNSGEKVGENMAGGEIYVGGGIESLGSDAMISSPSPEETAWVMAFLAKYDISFTGKFTKVVCAGRDLSCGTPEPPLKATPFTQFSGENTPFWNEKVLDDIKVKSHIGRYRIRGYGTTRHIPHFNDIAFKKEISIDNSDTPSAIDMRTFIGDRTQGKALDLSMPVLIAPMSLGALSPRVKTALGIASRLSGICENTGEGGMYSVERAEARQLIAQCLSGRLGWNIHDMKRSDALELYISQGAKPGLGGQLMAAKLTKEIADMRGIPAGMDLRSPSRHPDVLGGDDLIMKVMELKEAVGWRLPVSLKLGGGRTRDDVKIAYKDGLDFVELDGLQGGTGAGGSEVIEYVGIPTLSALMEAMDGLDEIDASGELPIVLMGGIQTGVDAAKAIALGATAVGLGTPMLIAAGCTGCMQCSSGNCPLGLTTQTPEYVDRFDVNKQAMNMHTYLESFRCQLQSITASLGYTNVHDISREDLVALTPEAAALTRLPYAPEYATGNGDSASDKVRETGSATYPKKSRDIIRKMRSTPVTHLEAQQEIMNLALQGRENPFPSHRDAHLDDVVFLSAALTRLVIDPYREACSTQTRITRTIEIGSITSKAPRVDLEQPFLFTGFDTAPPPVKRALARAISHCGCGYMGQHPLQEQTAPDEKTATWFQLLKPGEPPSSSADGIVYIIDKTNLELMKGLDLNPLHPDQLVGLCLDGNSLPRGLSHALNQKLDLLVLDATTDISGTWPELDGHFDLTVIRDTILRLRSRNMEEEICLINFGGLRSGTDVAKALALNCNASMFGTAMAIAMGGQINEGSIIFPDLSPAGTDVAPDPDDQEDILYQAAVNWIKGSSQEAAIIARCAGKTNIHNLEPEDIRSISIATSEALGIPLTSGAVKRERF